jgi:hypothetical protein
MIIWSGLGFIVAVVVFGCSLAMEFATESITGDDQFYQKSGWAFPLALIIAGMVTFAADRWIVRNREGDHSLFFIPTRWWAPILFVIAVVVVIYDLASRAPGQ